MAFHRGSVFVSCLLARTRAAPVTCAPSLCVVFFSVEDMTTTGADRFAKAPGLSATFLTTSENVLPLRIRMFASGTIQASQATTHSS